jgi:hypothetical protein
MNSDEQWHEMGVSEETNQLDETAVSDGCLHHP